MEKRLAIANLKGQIMKKYTIKATPHKDEAVEKITKKW